jgi:hypothetical protein
MYERTSHTTLSAASVTTEHASTNHRHTTFLDDLIAPAAGQRISELCGQDGARDVDASLHENSHEENVIVTTARDRLGLEFTTVSELNSAGGAFCGLFWDPEENFIIVSFKGTNPVDYMEWTTDFSCSMRDAGQWLSDFGRGEVFVWGILIRLRSDMNDYSP